MTSISCSICWDVILSRNVLVNLKCGHIYHKHCLDDWMKQSKTCPNCRKKASKPTRVYPHFESLNPDDLNAHLMRYDELEQKNEQNEQKIVQLREQLAEKDREISDNKRLLNDFNQLTNSLDAKTREIDFLNNECNDLVLELKKVQNENHMITIDLNGRNKLIECLQRVNTELEASQHSLEKENKRMTTQIQTMQESDSHRPIAKRQKLHATNSLAEQMLKKHNVVIDLTDNDHPITIDDDDDDDDSSKESDQPECVETYLDEQLRNSSSTFATDTE